MNEKEYNHIIETSLSIEEYNLLIMLAEKETGFVEEHWLRVKKNNSFNQ